MITASLQEKIDNLDVESFWEKGYIVIPDAFTMDEIEAYRQASMATRASGGELLTRPGLSEVITDGRLAAVARKLLGVEDILYAGDSSVTINSGQVGWHKDNADRQDANAPDWRSRYTQLRFGIYLQDHIHHSGGLNLREGSQDIVDLTSGKCLYLKTTPGDLAVWNMRITHSGNGILLKDPEAAYPTPAEHKNIPVEQQAPLHEHRMAVFAHLGANDSHGHRYADYLKTRTYIVNMWRRQGYSEEVREAVKRAGITLRDMPAEVANDPDAGLSKDWKPIPYEAAAKVPQTENQKPVSFLGRVKRKARRMLSGA
ncbi:hypothetical protein [uncultured Nitratireductor sp.]|uniref:hypothetical protein n=1 Tax=uncultured Nitratireductor sp. TaxID=520953 RepID=UPI002600380C|nr:hypothetical protein [uncultured Nitratireductor sp.]